MAAGFSLATQAVEAPDARIPLFLSSTAREPCAAVRGAELTNDPSLRAALDVPLSLPGIAQAFVVAPTSSWFGMGTMEWTMRVPDPAAPAMQVLVYVKDWDYLWYQRLLPGSLTAGATNRYSVDLTPEAVGWEPRGHQGSWHAQALMRPKEIAIRVFSDSPCLTTCRVDRAFVVPRPPSDAPPGIRDVVGRPNPVPCYERFELTFSLPDRYANPFDPEEVSVGADLEMPDGRTLRLDGFHTREFYRQVRPTGEEVLPQGPPRWRVRYAPTVPGLHRYTLFARDACGTTKWGPGTFVATRPVLPGFVRVSKTDGRYFEFGNGAPFFPIGHNIRSATDTRLAVQFPWATRWPEGTAAYARYLRAMREAGENLVEVWQAPWSLGLEWSPKWAGYHGLGQYNLRHAWEMDRVVEEAERNGVHLNVVIHNHGKFGTFLDAEWADNPLNVANGGFLGKPEEYYTNALAMKSFHNLMRYNIARWGYSTRIFAWQLWSEVNLTGPDRGTYQRPAVVSWHRLMGQAVKDLDPYDHLVSTHVSDDYQAQNTNIIALAEIDHAAVDAYYGGNDPYQIVRLLRATADFNNAFGKPVLVTEFGGGWDGQGFGHLRNCLHVGLWSSTAIPLGGTPLFWWWGLIEEENLYPEFAAVSRFMKDEDRRDPGMKAFVAPVAAPGAGSVEAQCLRGATRALGWIASVGAFAAVGAPPPPVTNAILRIEGMTGGVYRTEFRNTANAAVVAQCVGTNAAGVLAVPVPPFERDIAFKTRLQR